MSEPHPQVQAAQDAAAALVDAEPDQRVALLESIAAELESALSDNPG